MLRDYPTQAQAAMLQAFVVASQSKARRRKTGAIIFREISPGYFQPLSNGYNGTRPNECNKCEHMDGTSKLDVIHAERNCLIKMQRQGTPTQDTIIVVTFIPCETCCDRIIDAGVVEVVFCEQRTDFELNNRTLNKLHRSGIGVTRISKQEIETLSKSIAQQMQQDTKFMGTDTELEMQLLVDSLDRKSFDQLKQQGLTILESLEVVSRQAFPNDVYRSERFEFNLALDTYKENFQQLSESSRYVFDYVDWFESVYNFLLSYEKVVYQRWGDDYPLYNCVAVYKKLAQDPSRGHPDETDNKG